MVLIELTSPSAKFNGGKREDICSQCEACPNATEGKTSHELSWKVKVLVEKQTGSFI